MEITSPEALGFSAQRLSRLTPRMQAYVDAGTCAGISTLVARRGEVVHFGQVGFQDREAGVPLGPDTLFRIYSMTKPVVCTALMTLFEEGRFQLTDPVARYLPAFAKVRVLRRTEGGDRLEDLTRPITVRDLMTHTSGLTYGFLDDSPVGALYRESHFLDDAGRTLERAMADLAELPLAFQPGTRWHYSVGIDVAAHLIERLTDQPLGDALRERLFAPLGMDETGFSVAEGARGRVSAMYGSPDIMTASLPEIFRAALGGFNQRLDVEANYPVDRPETFARGGHGLFSTMSDYFRFAQMLLSGGELDGVRILAPKTVELMHLNHLPEALRPYEIGGLPAYGYGFGLGSRVLLDVAASGLPGSVGEFGWSGAAKTYYWVDPQEDLVGLFMAQYMVGLELPERTFQILTYQALLD